MLVAAPFDGHNIVNECECVHNLGWDGPWRGGYGMSMIVKVDGKGITDQGSRP
jgi:hypothetical protein